MLLSPRKNGLTSLNKEVRVFKENSILRLFLTSEIIFSLVSLFL